jgi:uncharacterized protein YktA (UPF0223 family)
MDDDLVIVDELALLASNIKKEVCSVLDFFHSLLRNYENKKAHNMVFLKLHPKFKSQVI